MWEGSEPASQMAAPHVVPAPPVPGTPAVMPGPPAPVPGPTPVVPPPVMQLRQLLLPAVVPVPPVVPVPAPPDPTYLCPPSLRSPSLVNWKSQRTC